MVSALSDEPRYRKWLSIGKQEDGRGNMRYTNLCNMTTVTSKADIMLGITTRCLNMLLVPHVLPVE